MNPMIFSKKQLPLLFLIAFFCAGCLKTRAQLKDDEKDSPASSSRSNKTEPTVVESRGNYAVEELKAEVLRLNSRIEDLEQQNKDKQNTDAQAGVSDQRVKELEARILDLEQTQLALLTELKRDKTTGKKQDPKELLAKAKQHIKAGEDDKAIEVLTEATSKLKGAELEEATIERADAYFRQKQYKKAIVDYSKFSEIFTKSKLHPRALLMLGKSFDGLGMKEDGAAFYQELQDRFPNSPEAKSISKKESGKAASKAPKKK